MDKKKKGSTTKNDDVVTSWPESLQIFVSKCFMRANDLKELDKAVFNSQLELLMSQAILQKKIWDNSWELQKLPVLDGTLIVQLHCNESPTTTDGSSKVKETRKEKKRKKEIETTPKPAKETKTKRANLDSEYDSVDRKKQRMERFSSPPASGHRAVSSTNETPPNTTERIVGRSTALEKRYLRLTSEPDPDLVRPQNVLQKSVKFLMSQIDSKPYSYIKDQFKSIRQDLTVQHIKNHFTLYVYETNARICIQNNDLGELNQCLTQIENLLSSKEDWVSRRQVNELEFMCYRVLYLIMVENHSEVYKLRLRVLNKEYPETSVELLHFVHAAFDLHTCVVRSDYYAFFDTIDKLKGLELAMHLVQTFLMDKVRIKALQAIGTGYRQVTLDFLKSQLRFDEDSWTSFVEQYGLQPFIGGSDLDCTAIRGHLRQLTVQKIDIKGQI